VRIGASRLTFAAAGVALVCSVGVALRAGEIKTATRSSKASAERQNIEPTALSDRQAGSPQRAQTAEEIFKNVQVLKGISVDDFMGTMGIMSAALGFDCSHCHVAAGFQGVQWDVDTPAKQIARRMTAMVFTINRDHFGGRQVVTCWTCHRGRDRPLVTPSLDYVYGTPVLEMDDILTRADGAPSADQVLDKYLQAIGGTERLARLSSYTAQGISMGFQGFGGDARVEIFAKAPDQRATYIHFADQERGASVRAYDGRGGWMKTPLTVIPEYALGGGELDGARLEAQLSFPAQIKQLLNNWRVSSPTSINDRLVQVLQGNGLRGLVATLYFDDETGLLVRLVRYGPSPIGRVPTQVDYADYREVGEIKMPFRWTFTWLNGRDDFELKDVQVNVPIEPAKFGKP
jgi:photosynthetic reaction center cytochrome c subunit